MTRLALPVFAAALLSVAAAHASPNLVNNGGFEQTTLTYSSQFTSSGVTGWTNTQTSGYTGWGYNFLIKSGTADTTGFYSLGGNHDYLWGPGNGPTSGNYSNNGMPASSPTGGNFIIADGDSNFHGAISQTINGLVAGTTYQLSFDWGAGQFAPYSGNTTDAWNVTFGGASQSTATVNTPSHGFTPWRTATMSFVATASTQVLSFLAVGTPNGEPPTLMLDNVNLQAVPEPASFTLIGGGLLAAGVLSRRRRAGAAA